MTLQSFNRAASTAARGGLARLADLTWVHSINNQNDTEVRFVHQTG
jgi:hypothetical protein